MEWRQKCSCFFTNQHVLYNVWLILQDLIGGSVVTCHPWFGTIVMIVVLNHALLRRDPGLWVLYTLTLGNKLAIIALQHAYKRVWLNISHCIPNVIMGPRPLRFSIESNFNQMSEASCKANTECFIHLCKNMNNFNHWKIGYSIQFSFASSNSMTKLLMHEMTHATLLYSWTLITCILKGTVWSFATICYVILN